MHSDEIKRNINQWENTMKRFFHYKEQTEAIYLPFLGCYLIK